MRRPRYKLQVSTFPFLAVLLCAMGSLLLFLFIMDRRAKIAAQNVSDEVLQARKKRTQDEEDKLQTEWEQAKEKLHQALLLQQGELNSQAKGLQIDLTEADGKLRLLQTHYLDLKGQAKSEATKIAEIQFQIAGRRKGLLEADKKETMSKKELLAAAAELAELEIAFQQLVSMKEREKQVHSLVPYQGKHGDSRKPIYIECIGPGIIFHPEERVLQGFEFNNGSVREEVERRGGKLTLRRLEDDKQPEKAKTGAYVLFLVRPSGIASYYRAQAAIKGFRIDFGYELIDQDIELDFGGKSYAKNLPIAPLPKQTEMPIDRRPTFEPLPPFVASNQGSGAGGQGTGKGLGGGSGQGPGGGVGNPTLGNGIGFGTGPGNAPGPIGLPTPGNVGSGPGTVGLSAPGNVGNGPGPIGLPAPGNVGNGPGAIGLPAPGNVGNGPGAIGLATPGNVGGGPGPIGLPAPGSVGNGPGPIGLPAPGNVSRGPGAIGLPTPGNVGSNPGTVGLPAPGNTGNGPGTIGLPAPGNVGSGTGILAPGNVGSSTGASPSAPGVAPGLPASPGGRPAFVPINKIQPPVAIASAEGNGNTGADATTRSGDGTNNPSSGPNLGNPVNGNNATAGSGQNPAAGNPSGNQAPLPQINGIGGTGAPNQGSPSSGGVTSPAIGVFGTKESKRPAPAPLSRMLGNKDFLIYIDCYDDHVNIFPGGMSFRWNANNMKTTDAAFAQAVAKLIERRQASVRTGEPPYRPLICFRVDPDGRHCYLHVYPLLESLRVPMTRENIEEQTAGSK